MLRRPLVLANGKVTELPTGDSIPSAYAGDKLQWTLASLAAFDRIVSISYHDLGLRTQRVNQIVATSVLYPDANVTKTVSWLDVGLLNQRIDKIEYTGAIFDPDSLRKVFSYSLNGIKYVQTGFNFETF